MDEGRVNPRVAAVGEGLPPAVERNLDDAATEPLDRLDLGVGRVVRRDDGAGDPQAAGVPGGALRHVAGAGDEDALGQLGLRHRTHRIGGTADLEGADRLEILELEVDVGRRVPDVELDQRRPDGGLGDDRLGAADFLDTKPGRLHIVTI